MNQERLMKILLSPVISEKSSALAEKNRQFVFVVIKTATKPEIKSAIEFLFKVEVDAVRVNNVKSKVKRRGQIEGQRRGWKKAIVSLKEGFDINFAVTEK